MKGVLSKENIKKRTINYILFYGQTYFRLNLLHFDYIENTKKPRFIFYVQLMNRVKELREFNSISSLSNKIKSVCDWSKAHY